MSSLFTSCVDLTRFGVQSYDLYKKVTDPKRQATGEKVDDIIEGALLLLQAVGTCVSNTRDQSLMKTTECVVRYAQLPLKFFNALENNYGSTPLIATMVQQVLSVLRSGAQAVALGNKVLLEMSPEEQSKLLIPIYETSYYDDTPRIIGYRPFDLSECQSNYNTSVKIASGAVFLELLASVYKCMNNTNDQHPPAHALLQHQLAAVPVPVAVQERFSVDFIAMQAIPEQLENDVILRAYMCPITLRPIRFPVHDRRHEEHVYEREAIHARLAHDPHSPVTGDPMTVADLEISADAAAIINLRLEEYSNNLQAVLAHFAAEPNFVAPH
ncbi:MAG: hypothetical protein P4L16_04325 [Chlamydiales bacterium]|nr:hypothetical protein [Chlamydiales bacterium]